MDLYLIRHTQPAVTPGHCYGQMDLPLAESFAADAAPLLDAFRQLDDLTVYSSPLQRCRRLAEQLSPTVQLDSRLQEIDFGHWEGRAWDTIAWADIEHWNNNLVHHRIPGGESLYDLDQRVQHCLAELQTGGHNRLALVTHQGVIRCLLAQVLGMPLAHSVRLRVDYGRSCLLRLQGDWREAIFINSLP